MNSMTIITYSFGFIVYVCSIIILDEITHMFGDYLSTILVSRFAWILECVHLCTCMYVCGCLNIVFQVFRCNYLYMKRLDCFQN